MTQKQCALINEYELISDMRLITRKYGIVLQMYILLVESHAFKLPIKLKKLHMLAIEPPILVLI